MVDPDDDPLGVDELVKARRRWDATIAEARQHWDKIAPLEQNQPADMQEDLSHRDEEFGALVNTEKVATVDSIIVQPPQSPEWRPPGQTA